MRSRPAPLLVVVVPARLLAVAADALHLLVGVAGLSDEGIEPLAGESRRLILEGLGEILERNERAAVHLGHDSHELEVRRLFLVDLVLARSRDERELR